jgi:hypothetical protein
MVCVKGRGTGREMERDITSCFRVREGEERERERERERDEM